MGPDSATGVTLGSSLPTSGLSFSHLKTGLSVVHVVLQVPFWVLHLFLFLFSSCGDSKIGRMTSILI